MMPTGMLAVQPSSEAVAALLAIAPAATHVNASKFADEQRP